LSYELVYIVRPTADEQTLAAVNEKVEKFIANVKGQMTKRDDWGKRRLAYPIGKFTEGFYAVLQLDLPATAVRDLERNLKLTEDVLRFIVVRVEPATAPVPAKP
jgi:small subunit ribosomal protein S6